MLNDKMKKKSLLYEIEVYKKEPKIYIKDIELILPGKNIEVEFSKLFLIEDNKIKKNDLKRAAELLFCDPIAEEYKINFIKNKNDFINYKVTKKFSNKWFVKVYYRPEVTDPASETIIKALRDINIIVNNVRTGKKYILESINKLSYDEIYLLTRRIFANFIVEVALLKPL